MKINPIMDVESRTSEPRQLRNFLMGYADFPTDDSDWEIPSLFAEIIKELDPLDLIDLALTESDLNKLAKMSYAKFLRTNYWGIIAKHKKEVSGYKCNECGHYGNLNVHHTTYKHRGHEIDHMKDLIVLK